MIILWICWQNILLKLISLFFTFENEATTNYVCGSHIFIGQYFCFFQSKDFVSLCAAVLCLVDQLCLTLFYPMNCSPSGSSIFWDSPGKNTGVGGHALLQGIFSTQGSNPGIPYCTWILYHLNHQGSPRILERVTYLFSRSSQPRNRTGVSCIVGGFFTSCTTRQPLFLSLHGIK